MKLIVGLGNPGDEYSLTRHNIGFFLLDTYASEHNNTWQLDKKLKGYISSTPLGVLLKPTTFMNNSGDSVQRCMSYYKVLPADLIVVHDDVDLSFGQPKFQFAAGTAGHHGVEDIVAKISTKDFWRLRVGAGRPADNRFDIHDWVLSKFNSDELTVLKKIKLTDYLPM